MKCFLSAHLQPPVHKLSCANLPFPTMPPKIPDKLTDAEKKKKKQENKAKADPARAEAKKEKNDACRASRKEAGSSKSFS